MTQTTFYAENYSHRPDVEHYLRTARRYLDAIESAWRAEPINLDEVESDAQRQEHALLALQNAQSLDFAAGQLQTYLVGAARFEHATWQQVGEVLDVSKQAVSERYRGVAGPQRGDKLGTLTADSTDGV